MKKEKYEALLKVMDRWYINLENGTVKTRKGIKTNTDSNGYMIVSTTLNGRKYDFKAHQVIVVKAGLNPVGKVVNHKNGIKNDNRIENLEVVSIKENVQHAHDTGLAKPHNKLPDEIVSYIMDSYTGKRGEQKALAEKLGVHPETVRRIIQRNKKSTCLI